MRAVSSACFEADSDDRPGSSNGPYRIPRGRPCAAVRRLGVLLPLPREHYVAALTKLARRVTVGLYDVAGRLAARNAGVVAARLPGQRRGRSWSPSLPGSLARSPPLTSGPMLQTADANHRLMSRPPRGGSRDHPRLVERALLTAKLRPKSPPTFTGARNRPQPFERKPSDGFLPRAYGND